MQFAATAHKESLEMGLNSKLVIPRAADFAFESVVNYDHENLAFSRASRRKIAKQIIELNPDFVMFCDDPISSLMLEREILGSCPAKVISFIHDALPHSHNKSIKASVRAVVTDFLRRRCFEHVERIVLLSKSSIEVFSKIYPEYIKKITYFQLGAHVLGESFCVPRECGCLENSPYILFFGRIDKYKGLCRLLRAWNNLPHFEKRLVIAGGGSFSEEERDLIAAGKDIVLVNRYIQNEEMNYLISNALCVVLPYIDATQSGIIPISYHFSTPVIVSDLPGLSEHVVNGKTGYVFDRTQELESRLRSILDGSVDLIAMSNDVKDYYSNEYNWKKNIRNLFEELGAGL